MTELDIIITSVIILAISGLVSSLLASLFDIDFIFDLTLILWIFLILTVVIIYEIHPSTFYDNCNTESYQRNIDEYFGNYSINYCKDGKIYNVDIPEENIDKNAKSHALQNTLGLSDEDINKIIANDKGTK